MPSSPGCSPSPRSASPSPPSGSPVSSPGRPSPPASPSSSSGVAVFVLRLAVVGLVAVAAGYVVGVGRLLRYPSLVLIGYGLLGVVVLGYAAGAVRSVARLWG